MMKNKIVTIIILIVIIGVGSSFYIKAPKTGYVIIENVYNNFDYKKEMEGKYKLIKDERKKILDSLELNLTLMSDRLRSKSKVTEQEANDFEKMRRYYVQKNKEVTEDNEALRAQYDKEVLTQLNQYVKDYGEENGYTYIFGNDNNGSLMYAIESNDMSKQIISYINLKYKGLK